MLVKKWKSLSKELISDNSSDKEKEEEKQETEEEDGPTETIILDMKKENDKEKEKENKKIQKIKAKPILCVSPESMELSKYEVKPESINLNKFEKGKNEFMSYKNNYNSSLRNQTFNLTKTKDLSINSNYIMNRNNNIYSKVQVNSYTPKDTSSLYKTIGLHFDYTKNFDPNVDSSFYYNESSNNNNFRTTKAPTYTSPIRNYPDSVKENINLNINISSYNNNGTSNYLQHKDINLQNDLLYKTQKIKSDYKTNTGLFDYDFRESGLNPNKNTYKQKLINTQRNPLDKNIYNNTNNRVDLGNYFDYNNTNNNYLSPTRNEEKSLNGSRTAGDRVFRAYSSNNFFKNGGISNNNNNYIPVYNQQKESRRDLLDNQLFYMDPKFNETNKNYYNKVNTNMLQNYNNNVINFNKASPHRNNNSQNHYSSLNKSLDYIKTKTNKRTSMTPRNITINNINLNDTNSYIYNNNNFENYNNSEYLGYDPKHLRTMIKQNIKYSAPKTTTKASNSINQNINNNKLLNGKLNYYNYVQNIQNEEHYKKKFTPSQTSPMLSNTLNFDYAKKNNLEDFEERKVPINTNNEDFYRTGKYDNAYKNMRKILSPDMNDIFRRGKQVQAYNYVPQSQTETDNLGNIKTNNVKTINISPTDYFYNTKQENKMMNTYFDYNSKNNYYNYMDQIDQFQRAKVMPNY